MLDRDCRSLSEEEERNKRARNNGREKGLIMMRDRNATRGEKEEKK